MWPFKKKNKPHDNIKVHYNRGSKKIQYISIRFELGTVYIYPETTHKYGRRSMWVLCVGRKTPNQNKVVTISDSSAANITDVQIVELKTVKVKERQNGC